MKHVFEFFGKHPSVTFTVHPYSSGRERPTWKGARVEGLIIDSTQPDDKPNSELTTGDALYIEGDIETVRDICTTILQQLQFLEEDARAHIAEENPVYFECAVCGGWYHANRPEHGDGRGMTCLRDGTVLLGNRRIAIHYDDGTVMACEVRHLKKGDKFSIREPTTDYERRTFVALEPPIHRRASYAVRVSREPEKL